MIVIGIMTIIAGAGLAFSFDSYRGYLFRSEYSNVAFMISKSRSLSLDNYNKSEHGIKFDNANHKYILFAGKTFNSSNPQNEEFPVSRAFSISGIDTIVFKQLSGNVDTVHSSCTNNPCQLTFAGNYSQTKTLTINDVGGMTW